MLGVSGSPRWSGGRVARSECELKCVYVCWNVCMRKAGRLASTCSPRDAASEQLPDADEILHPASCRREANSPGVREVRHSTHHLLRDPVQLSMSILVGMHNLLGLHDRACQPRSLCGRRTSFSWKTQAQATARAHIGRASQLPPQQLVSDRRKTSCRSVKVDAEAVEAINEVCTACASHQPA